MYSMIDSGCGIQKSTERGHLKEVGRGWLKSIMEYMDFVMTNDCLRRRQRGCPQIRRSYRKVTIYSTVAEDSIPADLILNWDHIGMRMVPVNDWTMTTRGSKRVSVTDLGDKRVMESLRVFQQ